MTNRMHLVLVLGLLLSFAAYGKSESPPSSQGRIAWYSLLKAFSTSVCIRLRGLAWRGSRLRRSVHRRVQCS